MKQRALQASGAPLRIADNGGACIPVRVPQVTQISADLAEAGWSEALQSAGLDSKQLVHWHAEGLLMYLTEQDVRKLLMEASRVSHPAQSVVCGSYDLSGFCWDSLWSPSVTSASMLRYAQRPLILKGSFDMKQQLSTCCRHADQEVC